MIPKAPARAHPRLPKRLAGLLLLAACAARGPTPVESWQQGDRQAALQAQEQRLAAADPREVALENLRLASMAYALGDEEQAERALRRAVGPMTTFQADGEFAAALVGAEEKKEWKGEPYEKMAAFLMLGALLHEAGDRGNALAMYKSAVLADTGTAEERFRSDFVPAFVMQALAYKAEGEDGNARQAMDRAIDAAWSRLTIETLTEALYAVETGANGVEIEGADAARVLLLSAMSGGATAKPREPEAAVKATISWATDLAKQQRDKKAKDRLAGLQPFSSRDFELAARALPTVAEKWAAAVKARPDASGAEGAHFARQLEHLLEHPPRLVLLVERGRGPRKIRTGNYGEVLTILPSRDPGRRPQLSLDGSPPMEALELDSLSYQATTRGGRKVDGFLKGKAVYKDAALITGYTVLRLAEIAALTDNSELATVGALVGVALMVSGAVTNPAADIRQWELAPERWYLVAANPEPGTHTLTIDGKRITVEIPERGQLVHLVPNLSPGGPDHLGPAPSP